MQSRAESRSDSKTTADMSCDCDRSNHGGRNLIPTCHLAHGAVRLFIGPRGEIAAHLLLIIKEGDVNAAEMLQQVIRSANRSTAGVVEQ